MDASNSNALTVQTFAIIWDINLKITHKVDAIDMVSPQFSLNPNKNKKTKWIRFEKVADKITIKSNFSSLKELKKCTTFVLNPLTCALQDVYDGFGQFHRVQHVWNERMRLVFELEMQCDPNTVQSTIWKYCITELKPPIHANAKPLNLDATTATHRVANNRGISCVVECFAEHEMYKLRISGTFENRNLFTVMLRKAENNTLYWYYLNTTNTIPARSFIKFQPIIIMEIHELQTSLETMSASELSAIKTAIKPHLTPSNSDVYIHVQGRQICTTKTSLSNASTEWRDFFDANEKQTAIYITDFDYETITEVIKYIQSGTVNLITKQLLMAADKFGIVGLKEFCEKTTLTMIESNETL